MFYLCSLLVEIALENDYSDELALEQAGNGKLA